MQIIFTFLLSRRATFAKPKQLSFILKYIHVNGQANDLHAVLLVKYSVDSKIFKTLFIAFE